MKRALLTILTGAAVIAATAQPKLSADNIDEVLAAMTLEEKAGLVTGGWGTIGEGQAVKKDVPGAAGSTQAIPRLGIPQTILADGPAGLRIQPTRKNDANTYYCTGFPVGTVMACTWNTELVEQMTTAMGQEVLEYGTDVLLAPGMNLHRNPLCGRNFEYFSEDPLLSGKISAAYVRGVQSNGVGVSVKHFATNNQEINRTENDSRVNQRALRELYLKGFEISIKESDPWTVMSSYNKLDGHYAQQSHDLLTSVLRDEWGFKGIVMTDWGNKQGTVKAVQAGNDLMEPGNKSETDRIIAAIKDGSLDMADLNRNVRRILEYIVKTPAFKGYKYSNQPDLKAHAELVRAAAPEGMVLLKNNASTLPVQACSVALFGLNAYKTIAGGTGSGEVNKSYISNLDEALQAAGFKLDQQLAKYYASYRSYAEVLANLNGRKFDKNTVVPEVEISRQAIQASASRNDMAVLVIGRNAGEGNDRQMDNDFNLTDIESQLVADVCNEYHKMGKKVTVILNIGGVIETASWKSQPDAILLAWTPGQEAGNSIADILTGKANPSGKLSMTFPLNYFDIPSSANFPYYGWQHSDREATKNYDYTNYAEGIWVGYRYFNTAGKEVSYPFGYGLSYTTFKYSKPTVKSGKNGGFIATITVTNTGKAAGKESVQLYVSAPDGGLVKPSEELKAFAKTRLLEPGESQTLTFEADAYTLASFNEEASEWQTAAGKYTLKFAANAQDIRATASISCKAKNWKVNKAFTIEQPVEEIAVR